MARLVLVAEEGFGGFFFGPFSGGAPPVGSTWLDPLIIQFPTSSNQSPRQRLRSTYPNSNQAAPVRPLGLRPIDFQCVCPEHIPPFVIFRSPLGYIEHHWKVHNGCFRAICRLRWNGTQRATTPVRGSVTTHRDLKSNPLPGVGLASLMPFHASGSLIHIKNTMTFPSQM